MTTPNEAGGDAGSADTTTTVSAVDENGIMDMDLLQPDVGGEIEDGELNVEEPVAETTEEAPETAAEEEDAAGDDGKKKLSGAQRSKIREQRLQDEIAERDRVINELRTKGTTAPAATAGDADPAMPKEEDFNGDYFAFTTAMTEYKAGIAARRATEAVFKDRQDADNAVREQARQRTIDLDHSERVEAAKGVITDFDAAMDGMKGVNVTDGLIDLIKTSSNSAVIAYHLAKNPSELQRLDRMPPVQMAKEIGRLEATLKLPEPKSVTKAPPPLRKAGGGGPTPVNQERILQNWLDKKYGKK